MCYSKTKKNRSNTVIRLTSYIAPTICHAICPSRHGEFPAQLKQKRVLPRLKRRLWNLTFLGMHDEIFHFEIFKNFMENLKYFKTPSLKYFMKFLIFIIEWLKTFKNMIKVYDVSRKYIMLFMHNNRYLPLTGLLTLLQWTIQPAPIVLHPPSWIFLNISRNISWNISRQKISWNFTSLDIPSFQGRRWVQPPDPQPPTGPPTRFPVNPEIFWRVGGWWGR